MARPKYSEDSLRKKYIKINLNDKEKEKIDELFKDSNYNYVTEMIRDIVLNNQYKVVSTDLEMYEIRLQLLNEARRIGNNFNQLLKHFNQNKKDNFSKEDIQIMLNMLNNIDKTYSKINENFKK